MITTLVISLASISLISFFMWVIAAISSIADFDLGTVIMGVILILTRVIFTINMVALLIVVLFGGQ